MFTRPADHDRRMQQMRKRAEWELSDASWADTLFRAYEAPDEDAEELESEMED